MAGFVKVARTISQMHTDEGRFDLRFGDQMITVHLAPGAHVQFSGRALVWVRGTSRVFSGDPAGSKPLYALEQAQVEPGLEPGAG